MRFGYMVKVNVYYIYLVCSNVGVYIKFNVYTNQDFNFKGLNVQICHACEKIYIEERVYINLYSVLFQKTKGN